MPVINPIPRKLRLYDTVDEHAFLNREGVVWRTVQGQALAQMLLGEGNEDKRKGDFDGVLLVG